MCLTNQHDSTKARRMTAIGCACLAIALSQRALVPATTSATTHNWLDAIFGFMIGISIALNLYALRLRNRNRENRT